MGLFDKFRKRKPEESNEELAKGGPFVSFVLLDKISFSADQMAAALKANWGIAIADTDIDGDTIGFSAEQKLAITKSLSFALDGDSLKIGF